MGDGIISTPIPSKRFRRWRVLARDWVLWVRQGRPRDMPVVVSPGILAACPHGRMLVKDWHWSMAYQQRTIDISDYADRLTGMYPVQRIPTLESCYSCEWKSTR